MALYQFQANDGEIIEKECPMKGPKHPKKGKRIVRKGKTFKRILSTGITVDSEGIRMDNIGYPRASRSMKKWLPGANHDKAGRPIIESKRHERSMCDRHGYIREADLTHEP